jgi:hypothetical protein
VWSGESRIIKFERNIQFLGPHSEVALQVIVPSHAPEIVQALLQDSPFPEKSIELGALTIQAATGKDVQFISGGGTVSFKGRGSVFSGVGIYTDPSQMLEALGLERRTAPSFELSGNPASCFVALRWGYDLSTSGKGSIALGGPGAVSFAMDKKGEALYAVIRRFERQTGLFTAITETVNSWVLPTHVTSANDLTPGTWLITQVDGAIALRLGARYGVDFNWVCAAELGGIRGDIGLRLELGAGVSLGFQANGSFSLVLGREPPDSSDKRVRFHLYRQRKSRWESAFSARATVQADPGGFLPGSFDDFVKAVFGVHGTQVFRDLVKWADPRQSPSGALAGVSLDYGLRLLHELTGLDPSLAFNEAVSRVNALVDTWNLLDHRVASILWKLLEEEADLDPVRNIASGLARGNSVSTKDLLYRELQSVDFFRTPAGLWLNSIATDCLLRTVSDPQQFRLLQQTAQLTCQLLDDGPNEALLHKLQETIDERLELKQIENVIDDASFSRLDEWLKARLAAFCGSHLDLTYIEQLRKAVHLVHEKSQEFDAKALTALSRKYAFEFARTYQQANTQTALLDVVFDLDASGTDYLLQQAVQGDFQSLLAEQKEGIHLNRAALTHQVSRHHHIEVELPFYKSSLDHINTALARAKAVDENEGRLLFYDLEAEDIVTAQNNRNSRLVIGGFLPSRFGNTVRVHSASSLSYGYSLRQVRRSIRLSDLEYELKPYLESYFLEYFTGNGEDNAQSLAALISALDKALRQIEREGKDEFGNALLSLELSLPSAIASSWLGAPADAKAPAYMNLSRRLQRKLRQLIPFFYFQDVRKYKNLDSAAVLLVYSSIPISTSVRKSDGGLVLNTDVDLYWDWMADDLRERMIYSGETTSALTAQLKRISSLLRATPDLSGTADFYDPARSAVLLRQATTQPWESLLKSLLSTEADIINGARDTGITLAEFLQAGAAPDHLMGTLARFGSKATDTFNRRIRSVYGGEAVRALGTMCFIEAAAALDPAVTDRRLSATLELIVVKKDSAFPLASYLDGKIPPKEDTVFEQRFVNMA